MRYSLLLFHCSLTLSHTNTFLVVTEFDVAALASPRRRNATPPPPPIPAPLGDDESDTDDDEEAPTDEAVIAAAYAVAQNALDA